MQSTELYLVTYKKLGNAPVYGPDYEVCRMILQRKGKILDYSFETDSLGKLHIHYLFECRRNPYVKSFIIKGYNVNFTPVYDKEQVLEYIHKQCANEHESNQLVDSVYARHNYLF